MTIWETFVQVLEDQLIESGHSGLVAHRIAVKALLEITASHSGERVDVPSIPNAVRVDVDAMIHETVLVAGVTGAATAHKITERTVQRALGRHRRGRLSRAG